MFPDIVKGFKVSRTKAQYAVNHGIAPYIYNIYTSDIIVLSFAESLNQITQQCEMDFIARCWDSESEEVKVRYWGSNLFGHARHDDLIKEFNDVISDLNPKKLYQISMGGPNVNLKFYKEIYKSREKALFHSLINIGVCSLHSVHSVHIVYTVYIVYMEV